MRLAVVAIRATRVFAFHDGIDPSGEHSDEDRPPEHANGLSWWTGAQRTEAGGGVVAAFDEAMTSRVSDFTRVLRHGVARGVVDEISHILTEMGKVLADAAEERISAAIVEW